MNMELKSATENETIRALTDAEIDQISGGAPQCDAPLSWKLGLAFRNGVDAYFGRWERAF